MGFLYISNDFSSDIYIQYRKISAMPEGKGMVLEEKYRCALIQG